MEDTDKDERFLWRIAIILNALGYLVLLATAVFSLNAAVGLISSLIGLAACLCSITANSKTLLVSSILLAIGIAITLLIVHYAQGLV